MWAHVDAYTHPDRNSRGQNGSYFPRFSELKSFSKLVTVFTNITCALLLTQRILRMVSWSCKAYKGMDGWIAKESIECMHALWDINQMYDPLTNRHVDQLVIMSYMLK